jgi:hypothetical protein
LYEVTGQIIDITSARSFFSRLAELSAGHAVDGTLMEAYSIAAVVRYCRCFTSGSRSKLNTEDLTAATPQEIQLHGYLRGVRDWHIAHPVNQQEVHAVHLIVATSASGTLEVLGASSFSSAALPVDSEQIELALSLTEKWISLLTERLVQEQLRLSPFAQALSPEQVQALPEGEPEPSRDVQTRRKQPRRN